MPALGAMLGIGIAAWLLGGCTTSQPVLPAKPALPEQPPASFKVHGEMPVTVGFTNALSWTRTPSSAQQTTLTLLSPVIETSTPWNELVVSWNIEPAADAGLRIEAVLPEIEPTETVYRLGDWSAEGLSPLLRTSLKGQKHPAAEVKTDTLVVRRPTRSVRLQLELHGALARDPARLRWVTASFCDTQFTPDPRPALTQVWGKTLEVPERSQVAYEDGRAWCSPTSVSMVLGWWSTQEHRPELDKDVPEVARGVNDPGWPGTGNWPFNMAYAGSFAGLRACAARLPDLRALEELIAKGVPVVLSVNPPALRGKPVSPDSGHLVICVGFTKSGDVVVNDPWARLDQGQRVRRVYQRSNVERAWAYSHNLAYLVAPSRLATRFPVQWR